MHHDVAVGRNGRDPLPAPLALIPDIGTPADARATRQRKRYALGAAAVTAVSMVVAVHFVYRPLDVLWFSIMRKFGM